MTSAPANDADRECKVSTAAIQNSQKALHFILNATNLTSLRYCVLGLVWHEQEGDAEPEPGFQKVRDEAEVTVHSK